MGAGHVADFFSEKSLATQGFEFHAAVDVHQLLAVLGFPRLPLVHGVYAHDRIDLGCDAG